MDNKIEKMNPLIIIQARTGSSRLPGKVMKRINGIPLIGYQIERLKKTGLKIVVATPDNDRNIELVDYVQSLGILTFKGDELNVLKRFYDTALHFEAKNIIRITGDNPLIDGYYIRDQIDAFMTNSSRYYLSEGKDKKMPLGTSFEMFSFDILEEAYTNAKNDEEFEHVTQYMVQNLPKNIDNYILNTNFNAHNIRLTVDTAKDFKLFEILITKFQAHKLTIDKIISLFKENDFLSQINNDVNQVQIRKLAND